MVITTKEQLSQLKDNLFLGEPPDFINSTVTFSGSNNILACEKGGTLQDTRIDFKASNSVIYLSASQAPYIVKIATHNNSVCYIGQNNYINDTLTLILSEGKNIMIGSACCISLGIWMRNADPHLVFSAENKSRINPSRSIYIGDHVWLGQSSMILKGSTIHSGSVIGAMSLVAGKQIGSNSCWGGNPVKKLKEGIFWSGECVHSWTEETTKRYSTCEHNHYTFENTGLIISIKDLEQQLQQSGSAAEKFNVLLDTVLKNDSKNRFYG